VGNLCVDFAAERIVLRRIRAEAPVVSWEFIASSPCSGGTAGAPIALTMTR
jgi:hypothetical protein